MELLSKIKHNFNIWFYERKNRMLPDLKAGYAKNGLDVFVSELLQSKEHGIFIDIGANDGVTINNSYYFETQMKWNGVAIEPAPAVFKKLKTNRKCHVIEGCVSPQAGKATFMELVGDANMFSTLKAHNKGLTTRRLRKRQKSQNSKLREVEVNCYTFSDIIEKYQYKHIDFLSLDTEGGELEILKSINFEKTPISVISVENNWRTYNIRHYLEGCGYCYIGSFGVDEIYIFGGNGLKKAMQLQ